MAGGMVGTGQMYKKSALQSMTRYATLDEKLKAEADMTNKQLAAQEKSQNMSMGAAAGMAVGSMVMPGVGTAVGAAVGGLIGSLF